MTWTYSLLCLFIIFSFAQARLNGEGIVGGDNATEMQFPYQVSIQILGSVPLCGGGILNERFILTAAHCVMNTSTNEFHNFDYRVVVNSTNLNNRKIGRAVDVETIFVPYSFKPTPRAKDIAVIKLKNNIGLGNGIAKLELPRIRNTYVGQTAVLAGYGVNRINITIDPDTKEKKEGNGSSDYTLKYLNVSVISDAECHRKNEGQTVFKTNICGQAVQRHKDGQLEGVCTNDSGGPLVIDNTVIGVLIASPSGCEESEKAATYTRVSSFMKFIKNVMKGIRNRSMRIRDLNKEDL